MIKAFLHFLGRGGIHPGALNANQGTHVAILLWRFLVFFFSIFFSPDGNKSGFELEAFVHPRGALAPPAAPSRRRGGASASLWEAVGSSRAVAPVLGEGLHFSRRWQQTGSQEVMAVLQPVIFWQFLRALQGKVGKENRN